MSAPMSWEDARDKLKNYREENLRNSEEIVEIWQSVLCGAANKLGDEPLDVGDMILVEDCQKELKQQFPGSIRVKRLEGFMLEGLNRFDLAETLYNDILKEDETNSMVRKRLVVVQKAQNKIREAIMSLNDYLKHYMADYEAWMELCDLYLHELDYQKAAYCMEEVIASNPHSHLYHQKYAEIKYTQGSLENIELARAHYAHALRIAPNNIRALYGFYLCASNIAAKAKPPQRKESHKQAEWAMDQIANRYQQKTSNHSSSLMKPLEQMLDAIHISTATS